MGALERGSRGMRRRMRAQALHRAPGAQGARQGRRAHRAAVAHHRRGQAAARAGRGSRGCAPRDAERAAPAIAARRVARAHLSGRSPRQPDDAFSGRARPREDDQGLAAPPQVLELRMSVHRALCLTAVVLAFVVVVMGAYVRLSDAGLGCPDWPFCYGKPAPAEIADSPALAKAWKEMGHRYLAGTLGVLILVLWSLQRSVLASAIVLVVVVQATLGAWTVTMLLKPAIVTAHLIGGMTTLALLAWLALAQWPHVPAPEIRAVRLVAAAALAATAIQIVLGGWVSANYAALACPSLPRCPGPMDYANAFHVVRELGHTAQGELLSFNALRAIH